MRKGRHEEAKKEKNVTVKENKPRKKLIKRLVITAVILGLICLSGVIGVIKARNEAPIMLDNIEKEQDLLAVDGQITALGESYELTIKYHYRPCSHEVEEVYENQTQLAGKTRQEVEKEYPDFEVQQFDEEKVVLQKELSSYCEKHYILIWEGNQLAVYQTEPKTENQVKVRQMDDTVVNDMTTNQKNQVKQGKVFSTMDEIDEYLNKIEKPEPSISPSLYPKNS